MASSPSAAGGTRRARVEQHERAGAVGVLAEPGLEAALAEQRRLLVAGDAGDRHLVSRGRRRRASRRARRSSAGPRAARAPGRRTARAAPRPTRPVAMSSSSVREALDGLGHVLAGELEDQPGVDRAEHRAAVARALGEPVDVAQQPLDLRRREVRVEHEAGALADAVLVARPRAARRSGAAVRRSCQTSARCSGSPVDGSQQTTVSRWLVMPTASSSPGSTPGVVERLAGDRVRDVPDLGRVVLDPARLREVLGELAVGAADAARPAGRRRGRSCRSCPGRWPAACARDTYLSRMPTLAVSAVGLDRPGIIAGVAERLAAHGANVTDSRMAILRGHFAMTLIVEGAERAALDADLAQLGLEAYSVAEVAEAAANPRSEPTAVVSRPRRRPPGHRGRRHARARGRGRQRVRPADPPRARPVRDDHRRRRAARSWGWRRSTPGCRRSRPSRASRSPCARSTPTSFDPRRPAAPAPAAHAARGARDRTPARVVARPARHDAPLRPLRRDRRAADRRARPRRRGRLHRPPEGARRATASWCSSTR